MTDSLTQRLKSNAKSIIPIAILSIALGISIYYNVSAPLPPNNVIGIIYKTDEGIDMNDSGQSTPRYSVHLCLFTKDRINEVQPDECQSYQVDKEDYESVKMYDVVRGQVISGPFKGYNIIDIQEVYSGDHFIQTAT